MSVFEPRAAFRPFEYPEVEQFKHAINKSFWLTGSYSFESSIHDYRSVMTRPEREAAKSTLLAISQVEVSLKRFWSRLGERCPKPEIEQVGATFAESEVRHADAYSHLLHVLGLDGEFDGLLRHSEPVRGRVAYLQKYINNSPAASNQQYAHALALFSIMVENVSLFSQFAVIQSFWKHRTMMKGVDNAVQATRKEEAVHARFGSYLFRIIESEHPEWFGPAFDEVLTSACLRACDAECRIIDWIFREGELDFVRKDVLKGYVRHRFNQGLTMVGRPHLFSVPDNVTEQFLWFDEEDNVEVNFDFFDKHPTGYSKKVRPITAEELF